MPLTHQGINPHIRQHITALPNEEHQRLKALGNTEPTGLPAISDNLDPDRTEGSELTYLHGVAIAPDTPILDDLDTIEVPPGGWAIFRTTGRYPQTLQDTWAATATEWSPPTHGACGQARK